jgi:hypothetical protein
MIRMAIQVVFINEADGRGDVHEIIGIDRDQLCPAALGLSLAEAKEITGGIQQALVGVQIAEWQTKRRDCSDCGRRRSLKGHHPIVFHTAFGTLRLDRERVRMCPCSERSTTSESPLADLLRERVSPEMLYLETKFASLVSYGLTTRLLGEFLPLDRPVGTERVRRHLFRVAEAHEAELVSAPTSITLEEQTGPRNTPPDGPLFVGMDGGYIRGRDQGWFEAIAGKSLVSFHRDDREPIPLGAVSPSSRQWIPGHAPVSSTRFANRACSHISKSCFCPTARTPSGVSNRTSPLKPNTFWTGFMSRCG